MNTLSEMCLGSEPTGVKIQEEHLVIQLGNGEKIYLPLELVSQIAARNVIPTDAQILVLLEPPRIDHVHVSESSLNVYLVDGRVLSCPLAWFPRLVHGSPAERNNYELTLRRAVISSRFCEKSRDGKPRFLTAFEMTCVTSVTNWSARMMRFIGPIWMKILNLGGCFKEEGAPRARALSNVGSLRV